MSVLKSFTDYFRRKVSKQSNNPLNKLVKELQMKQVDDNNTKLLSSLTVADLVELLQQYPQDLPVVYVDNVERVAKPVPYTTINFNRELVVNVKDYCYTSETVEVLTITPPV